MIQERTLTPELGIIDIADSVIIHRDLTLTVVYELHAWHEPAMSDEDFTRTAETADDVWSTTLPENATYQFLVVVDHKRAVRSVEAALPTIPAEDDRTKFLEELRRHRVAELTRVENQGVGRSMIQERRHYLAATFKPRVPLGTSWGTRFKTSLGRVLAGRTGVADASSTPGTAYAEALAEAGRVGTRIEYGLRQMGLGFERCGTPEIIALVHELLNPTASRAAPLEKFAEESRDLHEMPRSIIEDLPFLADTSPVWALQEDDLAVRHKYLQVGDSFVSVVALKSLPDRVSPGCMVDLLHLNRGPRYLVSYRVDVPERQGEIGRLRRKAELASALRFGSLLVKTDRKDAHATAVEQQSDDVLTAMIAGTHRTVGVSLSVALYEASPGELEEGIEEVVASMSRINGMRGARETYMLKQAFLAILPGAPQMVERRHSLMSPGAVDMMPTYDFRARHDGRGVPFTTPYNSVVYVDPFDTTMSPNANMLVVGTSGSGKSFLVSVMLSGYAVSAAARKNPAPYCFILDNGASYQRFAELCGGRYVPFSFDEPPGIDIFAWEEETGTLDEHISRLSWLLLDLLRVNERDEERFEQIKATVEQALKALYGNPVARTFKAFSAALGDLGGPNVATLQQVLGRYIDGPLARLFQPNPRLQMAEDVHVLCYDFKELAGHKDVASLALKLTIYQVRKWAARVSKRHHRTFVVLDESWSLLDAGSGGSGVAATAAPFINASVRMGRKEGMSVVGLSQELTDYLQSPYGAAIVGNSAIKFVGHPGGSGIEALKGTLRLSERQASQIRALRRSAHWHEFLLIRGEQSDVVRVPGDPLSRWVFATAPVERARIAQVAEAHPDLTLLAQMQVLAREGRA